MRIVHVKLLSRAGRLSMLPKSDTEKSIAFDEIKKRVDDKGGVLSVLMKELREAHGASKLGNNVVNEIQAILAEKGIAHSPADLPTSAVKKVRLYTLMSRLKDSVAANNGLFSEKADEAVRKSVMLDDYARMVEDIRAIVSPQDK